MNELGWSRYDTAFLIENIRLHPSLWNPACEEYKSRQDKDFAYRKVTEAISYRRSDVTVELVKKKIHSLRTQLAREVKCLKASEEQGRLARPKLWCFHRLSFLVEALYASQNLQYPQMEELMAEGSFEYEGTDKLLCEKKPSTLGPQLHSGNPWQPHIDSISNENSIIFKTEEEEEQTFNCTAELLENSAGDGDLIDSPNPSDEQPPCSTDKKMRLNHTNLETSCRLSSNNISNPPPSINSNHPSYRNTDVENLGGFLADFPPTKSNKTSSDELDNKTSSTEMSKNDSSESRNKTSSAEMSKKTSSEMLLFAIEKLSPLARHADLSPLDHYGQYVAAGLKEMGPQQARVARKIIADVLYVGGCGKLSDELTRFFADVSCIDDDP